MTELFNVGKIVNTQGIKGELRVISITDFPEERFQTGKILHLIQEGKPAIEVKIKTARPHKNFMIVSFEGFNSINDVEKYKGSLLKVAKEELQELPEDEFYYHEIIGLRVLDEQDKEIGKIKEILSPGANDVWVVERPRKKEAYLPYIDSVVKEVNTKENYVKVEIPEGLLDDEN